MMIAHRRRTPPAVLTVMLTALSMVTSCSIREDASPRVLPREESDIFGESPTGEVATGEGSIYLLAPVEAGEPPQLRSVRRSTPASPFDLLTSLLNGPNPDELDAGLSTALPEELRLLATTKVGTRLTVDLNDAITELSVLGQREALAQIVATAAGVDQIKHVRILVEGEIRPWPISNGDVTDRPLSIYDYPGFVESSQPPFPALPVLPA